MAAMYVFRILRSHKYINSRNYSISCKPKRGLVLGAYTSQENEFKLTCSAKRFDICGRLEEALRISGIKKGKARIFYGLYPDSYDGIAVVGLGKEDAAYNEEEEIDERKEDIRTAASIGCRSLQDIECTTVDVEDFGDCEASIEGANLGIYIYQEFKEVKKRKLIPEVGSYGDIDQELWNSGLIKSNAQNFARRLAEAPSNYMTPTAFAEAAMSELGRCGVCVTAHDRNWALDKRMGAFLSVTQGSTEPPVFLEMSYNAGPSDQKPIVLVGKGVTFDSGGISLKPANKMDEMRADMSGAASVAATLLGIAQLNLPINVIGLIPLCENMPSGHATKPGDIVCAMNGKNIQVDNTDAEGRLILADALCYASSFDPTHTVDIATLTGAIRVALGGACSGVFTNSSDVWEEIKKAGVITGDRMWRMPLYKAYTKKLTEFPAVDLNNIGKAGGGGACTAAAFLKEFAPKCSKWMHIDMAGVMGPDTDVPYLQKGMTGRPTRTLIQFVNQLSCISS